MQLQFNKIVGNLLQALACLILIGCVMVQSSGAALAAPPAAPSGSTAPSIYLAAHVADAGTNASQGSLPTDLEAILNQFLQDIPRGYYGLRDIAQLKTRLQATDLVLIDVREPSEYAAGRIDGAINIPLRTLVQNLAQVP